MFYFAFELTEYRQQLNSKLKTLLISCFKHYDFKFSYKNDAHVIMSLKHHAITLVFYFFNDISSI